VYEVYLHHTCSMGDGRPPPGMNDPFDVVGMCSFFSSIFDMTNEIFLGGLCQGLGLRVANRLKELSSLSILQPCDFRK
jgi:hypothetical protein